MHIFSASSHYLNHWWRVINFIHRNKLWSNLNQSMFFFQQNAIWKYRLQNGMVAILSWSHCVKHYSLLGNGETRLRISKSFWRAGAWLRAILMEPIWSHCVKHYSLLGNGETRLRISKSFWRAGAWLRAILMEPICSFSTKSMISSIVSITWRLS